MARSLGKGQRRVDVFWYGSPALGGVFAILVLWRKWFWRRGTAGPEVRVETGNELGVCDTGITFE